MLLLFVCVDHLNQIKDFKYSNNGNPSLAELFSIFCGVLERDCNRWMVGVNVNC